LGACCRLAMLLGRFIAEPNSIPNERWVPPIEYGAVPNSFTYEPNIIADTESARFKI
jgi:hypothetical protein